MWMMSLHLHVKQKPDDDDDDDAYACREGSDVPAIKLSLVKVLVLCEDKLKTLSVTEYYL